MSAATLARIAAGCLALAYLVAAPTILDGWWTWAQARERRAYVTVLDARTRQPVRDLAADALVIREDGVRREILKVAPATSPMPVAVVIDNSQAAAPTISNLRDALARFLDTIEGLGPVGLFTVADRPTVLQGYTTAQKDLRTAAARLFYTPGSGATLLDTIADVARGLARRESDRAAIVVITGENVEFTNLHYRDVLERLQESGAMMYAVVLLNPRGSTANDEARSRAVVLDRGPRETGGYRADVLTSMSFESQLATIGNMLRSQYDVTYARPESLIPPEKFEVASAVEGLEAYGAPARRQEAK